MLITVCAAPARQRANALSAHVINHVVCITAGVPGRTIGFDHAGQLESCPQLQQYVLKRPHLPVR